MPVYSARSILHSDLIRSVLYSRLRSTTMSLMHRVPAASVPRGNDQPASPLLRRQAAQETLLDNTKEKQIETENVTHYNATTYIRVSYKVRQHKNASSAQTLYTIPWKGNGIRHALTPAIFLTPTACPAKQPTAVSIWPRIGTSAALATRQQDYFQPPSQSYSY